MNHQLLLMLVLGLVYDFFEDSRIEKIDELTAEYEKLFSELVDEYKKGPYAVLCPEQANKTSALLGEVLSLIMREGVGRRSDQAPQRETP
jgi:Tfp pilus assembly protein PilO